MRYFLYIGVLSLLASCGYWQGEVGRRELKSRLTQEYAQKRSQSISDVSYQLKFDLTGEENFQGTTAVHFTLKNKMDLSLDFTGGEIQAISINGKPASSKKYNGFYITIAKENQKVGQNSVLIKYTHSYSKNGSGFYRYVDKKEKATYLYTNLEPYHANHVFPSFDQPDLKATYVTQVLVPKDWQVISANRESEVVSQGNNNKWYFPKTDKFSTYTFSLHAGDYVVWEDEVQTKKQKIPLRLFARKSLAKFVKKEEWFSWTKQGLKYFEKYFSYPYPYAKYDQVLVPDFNHGAMENVGAVTFNEDRFISRGEKTRGERRKLAIIILHEMAHMWFGNLVTMKWWDDLWLNESFATHSSFVALVNATEFEEGWSYFNTRSKQKAYLQDQSITTHPVAQDCRHTDEAFANFDAITYGKGASLIKQLSFLLGRKSYRKALKNYFNKYANGNTTVDDFISAMSEVSEVDLTKWKNRWLKTKMVNNLEAHFTCKKRRINHFELYQTGSQENPTLRTHKTQVATFRRYGGSYKLHNKVSVEYSGETTVVKSLIGKPCPSIVYPNYNDHDYVSVILDAKSLKSVESNLANIQSPFLRKMLWADLWRMVLDQKLDMSRYLEIVEFNGLVETDLDLLESIFANVSEILKKYYPNSGHPWVAQRRVWVKFYEQAMITKVYENTHDPVAQMIWFNNLLSLAESSDVLRDLEKKIKKHYSGLPLKFKLDQDMRWKILTVLVDNSHDSAMKLVVKEEKKDPSRRGQLNSLYLKSLQPELESKKKYFNELLVSRSEASFGVLRAVMSGLFPAHQKSLHKKFSDIFYNNIKRISSSQDANFAKEFAEKLVPTFCDQKSSNQLASFLQAEKGLSFPVIKVLKKSLFENKRCYKMRKHLMDKNPFKSGKI